MTPLVRRVMRFPAAKKSIGPNHMSMTPPQITALLFDKDGTLFDFHASWSTWARSFLRQIAQDDAQAQILGQAIGFDLQAERFTPHSPVIAGTAAEIATRLLPHLPEMTPEVLIAQINQAAAQAEMVPAVPLRPLLLQLRGLGLRIGLATNDAEGAAHAHLAAHDLRDLFDFIAGYDSGHGAKPAPGMCLAFAQAMGLCPSQVAMVGDSLHDLHAGRQAGMVCVGVLTGLAAAEDLAGDADVVLQDIGALPAWLARA